MKDNIFFFFKRDVHNIHPMVVSILSSIASISFFSLLFLIGYFFHKKRKQWFPTESERKANMDALNVNNSPDEKVETEFEKEEFQKKNNINQRNTFDNQSSLGNKILPNDKMNTINQFNKNLLLPNQQPSIQKNKMQPLQKDNENIPLNAANQIDSSNSRINNGPSVNTKPQESTTDREYKMISERSSEQKRKPVQKSKKYSHVQKLNARNKNNMNGGLIDLNRNNFEKQRKRRGNSFVKN